RHQRGAARPHGGPCPYQPGPPPHHLYGSYSLPHLSEHFRRERDDLHELLVTQLTGNRPEDAGTDRLELIVEEHSGVAVKLDERTIRTTHAFGGANNHSVVHVTLL